MTMITDQELAELGLDEPSPPEHAAGEETDLRDGIAELLFFVGTMVAAEKGIRGHPAFSRLYLAGSGKVCFVFDVGSAVLDLPDDVLPELAPAAEALLAYLEGTST